MLNPFVLRSVAAIAFLFICSIALPRGAQAQSPGGIDKLEGLWVGETRFGPTLSGELSVTRAGNEWRASIGKVSTTFHISKGQIRFEFPAGLGRFRGKLSTDRRAIDGFWIKPADCVLTMPDPPGASQAFATPTRLASVAADRWTGVVKPLDVRFTLYLRIFRNADGTFSAVFRNHDENSIGGANLYRVSRDGNTVKFSAGRDPLNPTVSFSAAVADSPEQIEVFWPDVGRAIQLTRKSPAEAANFFPRPPDQQKYVYQKPPDTGDGWQTARAADVGFDETALARLVERLVTSDPSVARPNLIHSLLIARRGKLVLDEYFFGFDRDTPHDTRSAGKTFASVLLGAAMRQGAPLGPEKPVFNLLAGSKPFANMDPRKSKITLGQLMTHTSGLCSDNDESPGNEGLMQSQTEQPNWWKYTLDLRMESDPGARYAYCSGGMNLVGAALTVGTRTWLPELFDRLIARPLQFGQYHWNLMPTDEGYLGGGVFLRSRDLLKVGQMYLNNGTWNGRQIVSPEWVKQSSVSHVHISPETTGLTREQFQNFYVEGDDGYAWHLSNLRVGDRIYKSYGAGGNGGQLLIVVPDLELIVVFTGGNYRQGGIWGRWWSQIVPNEIIPAIKG